MATAMFPIFISFIVQFTDVNERMKKEKSFVKREQNETLEKRT